MPPELARISGQLAMCHEVFASAWLELLGQQPILKNRNWNEWWCEATFDRLRLRAVIDAIVATVYGLNEEQFRWVLRDCDWPSESYRKSPFGRNFLQKDFGVLELVRQNMNYGVPGLVIKDSFASSCIDCLFKPSEISSRLFW